jgi:two-component system phosphate regulon sensor histidine kinase PhoR
MLNAPDEPETERPVASPFRRALADGRVRFVLIVSLISWPLVVALVRSPLPLVALGLFSTVGAAVLVRWGDRPASRAPFIAQPRTWPETGMRTLLDALDEPAFLTDRRGVVRYQNTTANTRYGPARLGDPLSFKLRVPEVLAAVGRLGAGERVAPVRFTERGPTERHWQVLCTGVRLPRRDGDRRPDFVLVRLRDETEAVKLDRMRGDFIANASHELRTPLASLTGFIETLIGPARNDEANRERFLKIMLEQAQRMGRLVDDLMSLSRIEMKAHVRPNERVDLEELLPFAADMLAPLARARGTSISVSGVGRPARIAGERDELIQVLSNLVENAVKYGHEGGHIALGLESEQNERGHAGWTVTVSDDGPGIAPEHLPRLTERFYRVDAARSREQKGTGLGLAIVKHIVNRHHGRLTFRSEVGEGTTVSVWLEAVGDPVRED